MALATYLPTVPLRKPQAQDSSQKSLVDTQVDSGFGTSLSAQPD